MDREEVIRMALQAGLPGAGDHDFRGGFDKMTRPEQDMLLAFEYFAELVAAKEREALKSCIEERRASGRGAPNPYHRSGYDAGLAEAQRILSLRARGATDEGAKR